MALWLHVHGGYPSYAESGEQWNQADWDASAFVKALKGRDFNGYVRLQMATGEWLNARANDRAPAFRRFGEWAAVVLQELVRQQQVDAERTLLMPVPSSSCVAFGTDAKGAGLVGAIAAASPGFTPVDGLHWRQALKKASEGGTRDAAVLQANLIVRAGPPRQIVLVDDVATSGGHLLACARALRAQGHDVEHAICAAQTVWNHPDNMWAIPSRDLEANPFANLLQDF